MGKLRNNVPRVRFKGFSEDWKCKQLNEIAEILGGGTPDTQIKEYWGGDIDWYSPYEIGKNIYAESSQKKITYEGFKKSSTHLLPADKTILFTSRAGIGNVAILKKEATTNQGFQSLIIDNKNYDVYFIYTMSYLIKKEALKVASGSTFLEISKVSLSKIKLVTPEFSEQTKIGNFFQKLDKLIELSQARLEQAKTYKKAMLQKMFPQQGETVPQIRFKGFSGDWRFKKLGQCFSERIERSEQGDLLSVTIHFGVVKADDLSKINMSSDDKSNYKKVCINDIAYNSMRMWQGASGISNYEGIVSPAYTVITSKNDISSLFFSYLFKTGFIINSFKKYSQGLTSDTWNLKYPALKLISIYCPCIKEQTKIGNFFQKLDQNIEQHQRKLEHYQSLKKAMLQRMFV